MASGAPRLGVPFWGVPFIRTVEPLGSLLGSRKLDKYHFFLVYQNHQQIENRIVLCVEDSRNPKRHYPLPDLLRSSKWVQMP